MRNFDFYDLSTINIDLEYTFGDLNLSSHARMKAVIGFDEYTGRIHHVIEKG